jgi:predicted amidohydrolase YtcJ
MAVVPGIVDGHIHPFWPDHVAGADLTRCATLAELRAALASKRERSDGGWVRGWGVDYGVFRDTGISGELLDQAVGGEPAVITIMDQHTALATPRALELAGVSGRAGRSGGERRGSPARSAQRHASQCGVRA